MYKDIKIIINPYNSGGDGQTKDCWESELNDTVNKLDRLMMLQENTPNSNRTTVRNGSPAKITTPPSTPNPIRFASSTTTSTTTQAPAPIALASASVSAAANSATSMAPQIASAANAASSTTKTFLNNSFQAVQQKMEELLPATQQTSAAVMQNLSSMKELPLLSRISNEISANTANTVKVLKRRLSLN